jgi:2-deoxy-D-gluconate 3-dehydrogenase
MIRGRILPSSLNKQPATRNNSSLSKFRRPQILPSSQNFYNEPTPLTNLFSIQGKTAICTGITGGLGKTLGLTLAEAGANIVSIQLANDPELPALQKEVKSLGREFHHFDCNIGDSVALRRCFTDIWERGIVPDILLNCAGTNRHGPLETLTDEDISHVSATYLSIYLR